MSMAPYTSGVSASLEIAGQRYINFAGSSYLGLSDDPEIIAAGIEALRRYGGGAHLARDQGFATNPHLAVESKAAQLFQSEDAMFVAGGYMAPLCALPHLAMSHGPILIDERGHYALRQGLAAAREIIFFRHRDVGHVSELLKQHARAGARPLVATDGVFATYGDIAPLRDIAEALAPYDGRIFIDDSHGFGVLGSFGAGSIEHHGLSHGMAIAGGSLAKAFASCGGIVLGTDDEITALRHSAPARGATSGPAAAAAMAAKSLASLARDPSRLTRLRANISYAKTRLTDLGLEVGDRTVPIAAFSIGDESTMRSLRDRLSREGILVYHTTYVGAPAGGVIRCGIFADHSTQDIDRLVAVLQKAI